MSYIRHEFPLWWWIFLAMAVAVGCLSYQPAHAQSDLLYDARGNIKRVYGCSRQLNLYYENCKKAIMGPKIEKCMHTAPLHSEAQVMMALKMCSLQELNEEEELACLKDQYDKVQACMQLFAPPSLEEQIMEEIEAEHENRSD